MGTFSGGTASTQFPLDRLHLQQLLPFTLRCCYDMRWGKRGWRHTLISQSCYGIVQMRNTIFLILSPCQSPQLAPPPQLEEGTQTKGGSDCHSASTQTEGGLGNHPSLKLLQEANHVRAQLEYELILETEELAERCEHKQTKQARQHLR